MFDVVRLGRGVLEYVANTLIFVLSGVIISNRVHTSSQGEGAIVHALDYAYALLLWIYLLVRPPGLAYYECAIVHALDYAYAPLLWVHLLVRPLCAAAISVRATVGSTPCHPPAGSLVSTVQTLMEL